MMTTVAALPGSDFSISHFARSFGFAGKSYFETTAWGAEK